MKNLTWQNPEQLFVAQELINKVKSKCCGIKGGLACRQNMCDIPDKFLQKQKQEKEDITKLRNDVNTLLSNLDISTEVKNDIKKILEYNGDNLKGFVFVKENNRITRIDDIHFADGLKILPELQNTSSLYKWTSMHMAWHVEAFIYSITY